MRYFLILIFTLRAFGAALTATQSGYITDPATFGGTTFNNGDTITANNGVEVKIPAAAGRIAIGNDSATAAWQCATPTGTGVLTVESLSQVKWSGDIKPCSNTHVGQGTHASYYSAASHYVWQQRAGTVLYIDGSASSRVIFDLYAGSTYSGGFNSPTTTTADGGQVVGSYIDLSGCGTLGGTRCMFSYLSSAGDQFRLDHCTITNSGAIGTGNIAGDATWDVHDCAWTAASPLLDSGTTAIAYEFGIVGNAITTAKTTGSRRFMHNFVDGGRLKFVGQASGATTPNLGWVMRDSWISFASSTAGALDQYAPFEFADGDWSDMLYWVTGFNQSSHPTSKLPAKSLNRTYTLADTYSGSTVTGSPYCGAGTGGVNDHHALVAHEATLDRWIFESWCGPGDSNGLEIYGSTNEPARYLVTLKNSLSVPSHGSTGGAMNLVDYDNTSTVNCGVSIRCPQILVKNNTVVSVYSGNPPAGLLGSEVNPTADTFVANFSNIVWRAVSGDAAIESAPASGAPADGAFSTAQGPHDYNWPWHLQAITLASLYRWGATAAYTATPGTHDQSGDPQFLEPSRNFMKWAQTIDPTASSWLDVKAHFAAIGTASYDPRWNVGALIDYVRGGFVPRNATTRTAGYTGGYVGALAPPVMFPAPSGFAVSR